MVMMMTFLKAGLIRQFMKECAEREVERLTPQHSFIVSMSHQASQACQVSNVPLVILTQSFQDIKYLIKPVIISDVFISMPKCHSNFPDPTSFRKDLIFTIYLQNWG